MTIKLEPSKKALVDQLGALQPTELRGQALVNAFFEQLGWDKTIARMNDLKASDDPKLQKLGDALYSKARGMVDPHEWNNPYFNRTTFKLEERTPGWDR